MEMECVRLSLGFYKSSAGEKQ